MKAIHIPTYTPDPSTLQPSYIPTPNPKADELLIRITHCSPQHADILHAQGKHQNNNAKKGWCFPPFTLGYDFAGVVHTLPPSGAAGVAGGLKKGDRVFGAAIGAFAEFVCVKKGALRKVPDGLSNETACAMVGQAVSYASVVRIAKVQPGETVMVSGASGGLGGACGARVVALVGDEGKAALMRESLGVDAVVVMREGGGGGWMGEVMEFTGGKGVDVVLDNTGMVDDALRCLAYFGRIVILGFAARKGVMEEVKMNKLLLKSATVVGYRFGESGRRFPKELEEIWDGYLGMMQEGRLKPLLDGRYDGLENVGRALGDLAARKVYGKIVVKVADEEETAKL
ncbi:hypothetical protein LTR91_011813 [Friedmanniomyces endolithicus]|uniref:Enoyl reductase (ER) domain-containing protein n=1 Tax=Friedmanniomyces endolithicus TaxID=329885 RepID=A0AAN6QRB9_9PEZI|nr:hypothetical protein LTR38_011595 [Friedmanniomyces endolithicus]KAK0788999.1 hypothetical protein LTR59_009810 [Friedmanniomyces endolithicus]KAK0793662.1 hypothetical protein LTR75_011075 [Friedmanniomyces endolithicus]KAK0894070.1 hypothetical protein LTR02_012485 [Friedmanniomyces endolithicus]KAK0903215.1 hypothetical protein LTR57_019291 [Friedmanniomyces endolithicus]